MLSRLWHWRPLRWVFLGAAVVLLITFLVVQRQSIEVSYGRSPTLATLAEVDTSVGLADVTVPTVEEMTALVEADPVVRLPGAIATWDEQRVQEVIGDAEVRILVAPPGLDEDARDRVRAVENATVRVIGTQVSGGIYEALSSTLPEWRAQFATADVTGPLVTLLAALLDTPEPDHDPPLAWRDPTAAELAAVVDDLRDTDVHIAPGATLTEVPATLTEVPAEAAAHAFPGGAKYVVLPRQPAGEPLPHYGPALVAEFPDTPIMVMYGSWIEYHGPQAEDFAELAAVSFYTQLDGRLSRYDYPQENVLHAFLAQVADIRYAGLFDRPLPYEPFDPLRVALPALPWLFAACAGGFLALSVRSWPAHRRRGAWPELRPAGTRALLTGLSALAVEMSLLADQRSNPALARGISALQAARTALDDGLPDSHVRTLLTDARNELDQAARTMGFDFFRPHHYLKDALS